MRRLFSALSLVFGSGLLILNMLGVFFERDPAQWAWRPNDTIITSKAALDSVPRDRHESEIQYVERMTQVVHDRMTNPLEEDIDKHALLHVGLLENWILWLAGALRPFEFYETLDWEFGLRRGLGLCSQQSKVLVSLLREQGIQSGTQGLTGHVVAWVEAEGQEFIADPDFGVVIPYSMSKIEENPTIVAPYYAERAEQIGDSTLVDRLIKIYGRQGNVRGLRWFEGLSIASHFAFGRAVFLFKWAIPLCLVFGGWLSLRLARHPRT